MKKNGFSTIDTLLALSLLAGSVAYTLEIANQAELAVDEFNLLQQQEKKQICKIRPAMCKDLENATL